MKPTLLCIPGIYDSPRVMRRLKMYFEQHGYHIEALAVSPNDASISIADAAKQIKAYLDQFPHQQFVLIGFSMGGIIARYFTQLIDKGDQVKGLITLGSPHNGTLVAYAMQRPGLLDMRLGSMMLAQLNSDLAVLQKMPFMSVWTPCDLMIIPTWSSVIKTLPSKCIFTFSHPGLISKQKVFAQIESFLEEHFGKKAA